MTQLILNGVKLPETSRDRYRCYPQELSQTVEMISTRMVKEVRGTVQMIEWSYDKMPDATYRQLLAVLRSRGPLFVTYLPDNENVMRTGSFWVQSITQPAFAFSRGGLPRWHNVGFTLREVKGNA